MTLCDTFRNQAFWSWDSLRRARSASTQLGEESLTDFNLLEIRTRHPNEVITKTFTKPKEAGTGADWEWWFTGSSRRWLGFRIQAKVLDLRSDKFEHLHYKPSPGQLSSGQYQADLLCQRAQSALPKRIPLYCLYAQWRHQNPGPPWTCGSFPFAEESFGCSLVDAYEIARLRPRKGLGDLVPLMTPWHCLVCCEAYSRGDLPERALVFLRERMAGGIERAGVELATEPPSYVQAILRNELTEPPDPDLRTITVFHERAKG
ncbi:MAG: DUF6615 family protein [Terriglobia bacterium]